MVAPLTYNEVRWMLDDYSAKRAGPLRWLTTKVDSPVGFGDFAERPVEYTTVLQELWQLGQDQYEWRDVEEVNDG
jgi:hypothetical protein